MKKSELKQLIKNIVTEVHAARKQLAEAKGLSGNKKASEKKKNTQMKFDAKSITSTDKPVEKKEGKKLPVKDKKSNTETDHVVSKKGTPQPPASEKKEKARPVGGKGSLKEEIVAMIRESLEAHRVQEAAGKDINKEIDALLKQGKTVYSNAIGRVGKILGVDKNNVFIQLRGNKRGVTTFNRGDGVKLTNRPDGSVVVVNDGKTGTIPIQTVGNVNEMAKKAVAFDGKKLTGSISASLRVKDAKSPTGWSLNSPYKMKDGTVVPVGTPVDAPSMTGKNYVAKGIAGMGRPKNNAADSAGGENGPIGLDVSAEINGEVAPLEFDFLNSTWPQAKSYIESEVMANLGDDALDPNVKVGQDVYDAIEKAKEADLDGKLNNSNNKIVLFFDPATKQLKAKTGVNELWTPKGQRYNDGQNPEDDSGYDRNDPKHPDYMERMTSMADMARDAQRDQESEDGLNGK